MSQNARYNKAIDLNELEMLAKTPPELRFLLLLCAGFDLHGRTSVKISNLEGRLRTINSKLKNVNQPELREVLKKLASDDNFSTELMDLIKERMDDRARSELKDVDLPRVPSKGATPTNLGKNAGVGQSNLSTFSISSDVGGGATYSPAVRNQLEEACKVLKDVIRVFGLSKNFDNKSVEEKILGMNILLKNEGLNLVSKIFGHNKIVLPFTIQNGFVLRFCKLNNYVYISNTEAIMINKRTEMKIPLNLFINWVGHISQMNVEIDNLEICSPLLFNSLMYAMKYVTIINYEDRPISVPKDTKLIKINLNKRTEDVIFIKLSATEMEHSWKNLENYEYDLDRDDFLKRLTNGVIRALQCDKPVQLDLSEQIKGCNAISMGR